MAGDYARPRRVYGGSAVDVTLPSVSPILLAPKSANRYLCIQRIVFLPSSWVASTLTFLDSLTNEIIGSLAVPGSLPLTGGENDDLRLDFTATGTMLSRGASLKLGTTNGAAGRLHLEAYHKWTTAF